MNKKHLSLISALLITLGLLAGCGNVTSSASSVAENTSAAATSSATATSEASSSTGDYVDYVHNGTVKLGLDYTNHDFYTDGVGQVTLYNTIDGDTAHFKPVVTTTSSDIIKARFFGIDTPESTAGIEEFGKGASNFTSAKLVEANKNGTIVVSTASDTYGEPKFDSTGERYVSLVWISLDTKNAPLDKLYLLNLWIVQEGWSFVKNVADTPKYSDTFYNAEAQAKALKLNLFSGQPDPLYNYGDYEPVTLLQLKDEVVACLADSTRTNKYYNAKVIVKGTVAGYSNNTLYICGEFTSVDANGNFVTEYAGINVFTGMSGIPSNYTKRNAYIQVVGTFVVSNFGPQISGATFPIYSTADDVCKVLIKAADNTGEFSLHTFEFEPKDLTNDNYSALYCYVTFNQHLTVTGGYVSSGSETTLYVADASNNKLPFDIYLAFMYAPDLSDTTVTYSTIDEFKGKTFNITGVYTFHQSTTVASGTKIYYQVCPSSSADMLLVG
jgi:endonuclease YncB( thermonuclease family)